MKDVMVDLETLGTRPGSALLSLGACAFDPASGVIADEFYWNIEPASCAAVGLTTDPETLAWWEKQDEAARKALEHDRRQLKFVLYAFGAWWMQVGAKYFWAHAPNFDETLLAAAYRACGIAPPWDYWNCRCTRTIYALAEVTVDRAQGTHHNALDDARAQAKAVINAYDVLGVAPRA